jgi:hypothetical protein
VAWLFVVAGIVGCVEAPRSEPVGYVSIPLTATGASGAIYHLPPGSQLLLTNSSFTGAYSVDGDGDQLTAVVPPGGYSVFLFDNAGDTTVWPLTRDNPDGTTETVPGTLDLTPTITVVENQTTSLVIRFQVAATGPITFGRGSVGISVEVDETTPALDIDIDALRLSVQQVDIGETAPAALAPRLPGPGGSGDIYQLHLHTAGVWVARDPHTICTTVTASVEASGNAGLIDLVAEAPPSGGEQLCIDQLPNGFALMSMGFNRQGDASTELLSDLGSAPYIVVHGISVTIQGEVYDGRTLHLEVLFGAHDLNMLVHGAIFATEDSPFGPIFQSWYQLNESGAGRLTFTAH